VQWPIPVAQFEQAQAYRLLASTLATHVPPHAPAL
jgi:hypothetical protein